MYFRRDLARDVVRGDEREELTDLRRHGRQRVRGTLDEDCQAIGSGIGSDIGSGIGSGRHREGQLTRGKVKQRCE